MTSRNIRRVAAATLAAATLVAGTGAAAVADRGNRPKPTVVLVHGAFADSSGWNDVVRRLRHDGYPVVSAANPLRGVASDAAAVTALLDSVDGPIVLVGHSYGGMVSSRAAAGDPDVKALVYVAAFAPSAGESANELAAQFPGSSLGETLRSVPLPDGGEDLYVDPKLFPQQFAADVPRTEANLMAVAQRPITAAALSEDATGPQAWQTIPSYFLVAEADRNIPAAAQHFMARRARGTVRAVEGASHAVFVSRAATTASLIEKAARERV
ncbi:alpha/beta fold hydrolase [Micromonospora humi]|uniref:Pimeloyl-ACP methyl ester carboxylesterase n=1 Tax=Micromonospora humi TaxID=745366 RepID=A0A1C5K3J1_9ACTN|nr:alpha/beta hydrolase [Micromonospora humi]SCG77362.1 Pimeloyl-ACP methyl ester carboxylesterase [Micromonospora humi]